MSLKQISEFDRLYLTKLTQQIRILRFSKRDWNVQDVARFLNLIKIDEVIGRDLRSLDIDGSKLFDFQYLTHNLQPFISETNFFPIYKLFFIVAALLEGEAEQSMERSNKSEFSKKGVIKSLESEVSIQIEEAVIVKLKEQLGKIYDAPIMELGSGQVQRLLKSAGLNEQGDLARKWNIDGFSLVCIVAGSSEDQAIRNYYSDEQIKVLQKLSHIFLHLYYCQYFEQRREKNQKKTMEEQINSIDQFNIEFTNINAFTHPQFQFDVKRSMASSEFGTSEAGGDVKDSEQGIPEDGEAVRESALGFSVRGSIRNSQLGVSERGSIKNSQYGQSQRGSIRNSMAQSSYTNSEIMDDTTYHTKREKDDLARAAEVQTLLKGLAAAAVNLPFNLLNLQPIQRIKISSISYPFNFGKGTIKKQSKNEMWQNLSADANQKSESIFDLIESNEEVREFKIFNLSGAKFGRASENDFSYPDELSISSKHAQIVFKNQSYYIRDLGSKTGTFIYISEQNPLVLADEQVIQLSYEVEVKVTISKSDINEGVIKFQFKKPDNEPPYRATLKNNNTVRIGKAQKSHIRLANQSISSYHAEIRYEHGKFIMFDCNTRTGTWLRLSGKGIRSADRKLSKHDIIRISSKKTFYIEEVTDSIQFHCCQFPKKNG